MTARNLATLALALLAGCDATLPWADVPPSVDSTPPTPSGSISVSTTRLESAVLTGETPADATVRVTLTGDVQLVMEYWNHAIATVTATDLGGGVYDVTVKHRVQERSGQYYDSLVLHACADRACTREVATSPIAISITVDVWQPSLQAPDAVHWQWEPGQAPPVTDVAVTESRGEAVSPAVSIHYQGASTGWLTAGPAEGGTLTTPGDLRLAASPQGLAPGFYEAYVHLDVFGSSRSVYVALAVEEARIRAAPESLGFRTVAGLAAPPAAQELALTTAGATLPYTVEVSYGYAATGWLEVAQSGTAPGTLVVRPSRTDLPPNRYDATVTLRAGPGGATTVVPVSYLVTPPEYVASPASVTFAAVSGAATIPAAQSVALATDGPDASYVTVAWQTDGASGWVDVTESGSIPGTLSVRPLRTDLPPGTHHATLQLNAPGGGWITTTLLTVPLTFVVSAPAIALAPASLAFDDGEGAPGTLARTVALDDGGAAVPFVVTGSPWLAVTPASGTTGPGTTLTVKLRPEALGALGPGTHVGHVAVSSGVAGEVARIPVTLTTTAPTVSAVTPWVVAEGDALPVIVRGRGLTGLAAADVRVSGVAAASLTAVSDTELHVRLPALAPGRHPVTIAGVDPAWSGDAAVHVVAVAPAAPATGPSTEAQRTALIRDDVRGAVYASNTQDGMIERWRDANGLARETLALPGLKTIALTPDGARILALAGRDVWEIDPVAFTKPAAPVASTDLLPAAANFGYTVAFANDGQALVGGEGISGCIRYDWRARTAAPVAGCDVFTTTVAATRDGRRLLVAQKTTNYGAFIGTYDASASTFSGALPGVHFYVWNALWDRTGTRLLSSSMFPQVYDAGLAPVPGRVAGGIVAASAVSDDGERVYTLDAGTPVLRVSDVSAPMADATTNFPELATPVTLSVNPGYGTFLALSADERTIYVLGHDALVVFPLP